MRRSVSDTLISVGAWGHDVGLARGVIWSAD